MPQKTAERYYEGIGRRKRASARVRLVSRKKYFIINDRELKEFFPIEELSNIARESLSGQKFGVSVKVGGGGIKSQAEAIRLGIARALVKFDEALRPALKTSGFLKRDPRKVERKKPGLKKARRAPQWQKR